MTNYPGIAKVAIHPEYSFVAEHYEKSITLPGLYEQNLPEYCNDMIAQGLTHTGENLVISAYSMSGHNSILYVMDLKGNLQNIVDLGFVAHVGGISYDEEHDLLWVTGPAGMVYGLSWSAIKNGDYTGDIEVSFDVEMVNHAQVKVASFLTIDRGMLYVGSYVDGGNGKLKCYDITEPTSPLLINELIIPERIQGMTFQEDAVSGVRYMILSQGHEMEDACLLRFVYDEQNHVYEMPQDSWIMPEGIEQIQMTATGLYILFESSARPYRETARVVNDQIYVVRM